MILVSPNPILWPICLLLWFKKERQIRIRLILPSLQWWPRGPSNQIQRVTKWPSHAYKKLFNWARKLCTFIAYVTNSNQPIFCMYCMCMYIIERCCFFLIWVFFVFFVLHQGKQNEANYLRQHRRELVEELARTIVQKVFPINIIDCLSCSHEQVLLYRVIIWKDHCIKLNCWDILLLIETFLKCFLIQIFI